MNSGEEIKETELKEIQESEKAESDKAESVNAESGNAENGNAESGNAESGSAENGNAAEQAAGTAKIRRHKILGKPILGAILVTIFGFLFYQILSIIGRTDIGISLMSVISAVLLLIIHKWWFRPEYRGSVSFDFLKERKILTAMAVFIVLDIAMAVLGYIDHGFAAPALLGMTTALGAGTVEEAVFRGLPVSVMMRSYKDRKSFLPALIIPAIIFGSIHLINLGSGQDIANTVMQAVSACASGIFFGALYLRTGSIVPSMFIHVLHDALCSLQANQADAVITGSLTTVDMVTDIILMVVNILIAVWILRGENEKIREIWQHIWNNRAGNAEK